MPTSKSVSTSPFQMQKQDTTENIPYLKDGKRMAILRNTQYDSSNISPDQNEIDKLLDEQNITFMGILCTNTNIVNPNNLLQIICQNIPGDILVEYDRYVEITENPLVIQNNDRIVVLEPTTKQKKGNNGMELKGLLAYNKITFKETSIVHPQDSKLVLGNISETSILFEEKKLLEYLNNSNAIVERPLIN